MSHTPNLTAFKSFLGQSEKCIRETKAGYYGGGISPIDTTLPIKKGGVPFRLGFFQQTVFQAAGHHPLAPLAVQKNQ